MDVVNKLSVKIVCGKVQPPEDGERKRLMLVGGVATGYFTKTTNYGESIGLKGDFIAVNMETGEEKRAGKLWLPDVALNPIVTMLTSDDVKQVELGLVIGVEGDETVPMKYKYFVEFMREPENDPIQALADNLKTALKALE